jgi:hypothetical protein
MAIFHGYVSLPEGRGFCMGVPNLHSCFPLKYFKPPAEANDSPPAAQEAAPTIW